MLIAGTPQMDAQLRVLSPRVPLRKLKILRQCQGLGPDTWAVVDVSVDGILGHNGAASRLLPTGCLIQRTGNGGCKVMLYRYV
jgi:hypothetical protein